MRHMGAVHFNDPNFHVCCGVHGCPRTYTNFESFRKHLYRRHHCELDLPLAAILHGDQELQQADEVLSDTLDDSLPSSGTVSGEEPAVMRQRQTALFLMKAHEVRKVSQTSLDWLVANFTEMCRSNAQFLLSELHKLLSASGLRMDYIEGLRELFQWPEVVEPFHGLQS